MRVHAGVWPSEEVLAHYCLQNPEQLRLGPPPFFARRRCVRADPSSPHACRNKRVCEVGAGLGLAGLVAATHLSCASVLITDGNDKAAQSAYPPVPCVVRLCVISPTHQIQILLAAWNTTPF